MWEYYDLCLINPPAPWLVHPHAQAPLGLLYLAAAAEHAGGHVTIRNLAGAGDKPRHWRFPHASVYGVTGTYQHIAIVNALCQEIKTRSRLSRVLVGGPIALSRDELDMDYIDTVILGEAENEIRWLQFKAGPPFLEGTPTDVKNVPWPARHLWAGPFGGNVFIEGKNYFGGGSATIITSRGCPFSCAFCASQSLLARKVRRRDPADVVGEMERCIMDYGVRQFRFSDEFLTVGRKHALALSESIRKSKALGHGEGVAWRASIGINPHDRELFKALRAAGCREVSFGVESADPAVLGLLTNKHHVEDVPPALLNAREAGLQTRALMMVGLPGSTHETGRLNNVFLRACAADAIAVTVFTPVPGCDIVMHPERYGCRLIPERIQRSLCMYGPQGRNVIEPTIEVDGLDDEAFARQMRETVNLVEGMHRIGHG